MRQVPNADRRLDEHILRALNKITTTDVYMQEIPESVKATVAAINKELRLKPKTAEAS